MPNSHVWLTASELDRAALDQVAWATVTALSMGGKKNQDEPRGGRFGGIAEGLRDPFLETFPSGWAYSTYWQVEGNCDGGAGSQDLTSGILVCRALTSVARELV